MGDVRREGCKEGGGGEVTMWKEGRGSRTGSFCGEIEG